MKSCSTSLPCKGARFDAGSIQASPGSAHCTLVLSLLHDEIPPLVFTWLHFTNAISVNDDCPCAPLHPLPRMAPARRHMHPNKETNKFLEVGDTLASYQILDGPQLEHMEVQAALVCLEMIETHSHHHTLSEA